MPVTPAVLHELVQRHALLSAQSEAVRALPRVADLLRDTAYTLCAVTGTSRVQDALAAARAQAGSAPDPAGSTSTPAAAAAVRPGRTAPVSVPRRSITGPRRPAAPPVARTA